MKDLFGFNMLNDYEQRKISNFSKGELIVDTCSVTDSDDPYETGVRHPNYNKGEWVIVETYATKKLAEEGHKKWVKVMTSDNLPEKLDDSGTCFFAKIIKIVDKDSMVFKKAKKTNKNKAKNETV